MTDLSQLSDADLQALYHQSSGPDVRSMVASEAQRQGVDPSLALRVARQESGFRTDAISPKGARGPMQLMPATARGLGVNPDDPADNVRGGVTYLKQQLDRFGDPKLALAAYNAGPGAVQKYGGVPPYAETQNYVANTAGAAPDLTQMSNDELKSLYAGASAPTAPVAAPAQAPAAGPAVLNAETGKPYNPAQDATYRKLIQAGQIDPNAAPGSKAFPRGLSDAKDSPKPGEWYVDTDGKLRQAPEAAQRDQVLGFEKGTLKPLDNAAIWLEGGLKRLGVPTDQIDSALGMPSAQQAADSRATYLATKAKGGVLPGRIGEFAGNVAGTLPLSTLPGGVIAQGAASGALLSDNPNDAGVVLRDAAIGGAAGKVGEKALGLFGSAARSVLGKAPKIMDLPALQAAKKAAYDAVDASGFVFPKAEAQAMVGNVQAFLAKKGGRTLYPEASQWVGRLKELASQKGGLPLSQLDDLRGDVYTALVKPGGKDSVIGSNIRQEIDKLTASAAEQNGLLRTARELNTRWAKASVVSKSLQSAELKASRAYTGKNVDNSIRQQMSPLIDPSNAKHLRNLTPDETAALRRTVDGSGGQNAARTVGALLDPRGILGMGLQGTLGVKTAGLGNLVSIPVGYLSTVAANRVSQRNVSDLLRLIAAGGSKEALKKAPTAASRSVARAAQAARPAAGLFGATAAAQARGN